MSDHLAWPVRSLPRIRIAGRFPLADGRFERDYRSPTHALHLHDYRCTMQRGHTEQRIEPGDVTLSPARKVTRYALPEPGKHLCIHFEPAQPALGPWTQVPLHRQLGGIARHFSERIERIIVTHARAELDPVAGAMAAAELLLVLLDLAASSPNPAPTMASDAALARAATLIESRLDSPLTVPALAHAAGLSPGYFARRFRQRFGRTVPRYVLDRRIAAARHLLTNTDSPIKQIAARVGMPDPHHFNKQFRLLTGMSPSAWRRRA